MSSDEETFSRGAVVRVTLRNFLTYDDVTVHPGKRLNLLIGPNGSGKSTIVAALVLGLAGSPQTLGRATKIALYIKEGTQEGSIELELYDPDGNHVISRKIHKNTSTWTYNGDPVTEDRVKKVVAQLNIQVDNLCQILPQERVQDFVKMNAQDLLEGTEKAVGYPRMYEDHLSLKSNDDTKVRLKQQVAEHYKTLENVTGNIGKLQVDVDNQQKREKFEKNATRLKHRREWLKHELAETEFGKLRKLQEDAKHELNDAEKVLEPRKKRLALSEKEEKSFKLKHDTCIAELREKRKAVETQCARAKHAEDEVERLGYEQRGCETKEAARQTREDGFRQKLEAVKRELANAEDPGQALDGEIRACDLEIRKFSENASRRQEEQDQRDREHSELVGRVNGLQNELSRVRSVADRRLEMLRQRNGDVYKAVLWLRANHDKFEHTVHEPMILLMDVRDTRLAKYVSGAVPWNDLLAFTSESRADMNSFLKEMREGQRLRISCVLSDPSVTLDRPQRSPEELRAIGFQYTVGDLFTAPEAVRRYLFKTHRLQNIPVADVAGEAAQRVLRATQDQRGLNSFMIGDFKYRSGQSQYGNRQTWTSSETLRPPDELLTLTTDTTRERQLEDSIGEATQRQTTLRETKAASQASVAELNERLEQARRTRRDLTARRDSRRVLEVRCRATERSLQLCQQEKCDLPAKARDTAALVDTQLQTLQAVHERLLTACQGCQALELRGEALRVQLDLAKRRSKEADRELREANKALEQLRHTVKETANEADAQRAESKRLRCAALKRMERPDDGKLVENLQRYFRGLPNTLEDVEADLREAEARAAMLSTDDGAVQRYHELKQQQAELTRNLEQLQAELTKLRDGAERCLERWLNELKEIVTEVNQHFGQFFREMECAGEVALSRPESGRAADYGIAIRVKFRASEQLCELSGTHHSGGERSVATMLYVMALQHLKRTSVPFHCVDEINQGMDARNERRVFELVVRAACRRGGAQYFLVTPKLLPKLEYPPHGLTVLCVFSPVMGPRRDWDTKAFLRRKKRAYEAAVASRGAQ